MSIMNDQELMALAAEKVLDVAKGDVAGLIRQSPGIDWCFAGACLEAVRTRFAQEISAHTTYDELRQQSEIMAGNYRLDIWLLFKATPRDIVICCLKAVGEKGAV